MHAFALDFWRNNIGFDLEINNSIDKEGDAGPKHIEAEQKGDKKSSGLLNRLKRYRDEYNKACLYAIQNDMDMSAFGYYMW